MPDPQIVSQIKSAADNAAARAEQYSGLFGQAKAFIIANFGETGLMVAYLAAAVLVLAIMARLAKITFSALKYLVLPAVGLAFLGTFFFPYSFFAMLPVTVTACSLVFLFKA